MMVRYCPMWLPVNSSNFLAPGPLNWKVTMGWPVLTWPPSNPARASPRSAPVTMTSFFRGTVFFSGPGGGTPGPAASHAGPRGRDWLRVLANSSSAVCPMIRSARWGSSIPGSSTMMRRSPSRWIVGSTTPSWSMRLRMTSIAASTAAALQVQAQVDLQAGRLEVGAPAAEADGCSGQLYCGQDHEHDDDSPEDAEHNHPPPQHTKKDACDVGAVRLTARPTTGLLYRPRRVPTNPASAWTHVRSHYTIGADMSLFPDAARVPPAAPAPHNSRNHPRT